MRLVGVVAVRAQQILLVPVPLTDAPSVHACPPVAILLAVTLTAQPVRLGERHRLAAGQVQLVAVVGVVTIEAPAVFRVVPQLDIGVEIGEHAPRPVRRHLLVVALRAREDAVAERRRGDLDP
jgi:hypothetical protein